MRDGRLRRWELTDCLFRHGSKQSKQDKTPRGDFPPFNDNLPCQRTGREEAIVLLARVLEHRTPVSQSQTCTMASSTSRESFESVFPSLVQDLLDHAKKYNLPENALQWFEKVHSDT